MSRYRAKICACAGAESRKSRSESAGAAIDPRFGESADAAADYDTRYLQETGPLFSRGRGFVPWRCADSHTATFKRAFLGRRWRTFESLSSARSLTTPFD